MDIVGSMIQTAFEMWTAFLCESILIPLLKVREYYGIGGRNKMFSKIRKPSLIIYDDQTDELVGAAKFVFAQNSEKAIYELLNNNIKPSSLLLLNLNLFPTSDKYRPPPLYQAIKRRGVIRAEYTESDSNEQIPIDIHIRYDARANSGFGYPYHIDSVLLENIQVQAVEKYY